MKVKIVSDYFWTKIETKGVFCGIKDLTRIRSLIGSLNKGLISNYRKEKRVIGGKFTQIIDVAGNLQEVYYTYTFRLGNQILKLSNSLVHLLFAILRHCFQLPILVKIR